MGGFLGKVGWLGTVGLKRKNKAVLLISAFTVPADPPFVNSGQVHCKKIVQEFWEQNSYLPSDIQKISKYIAIKRIFYWNLPLIFCTVHHPLCVPLLLLLYQLHLNNCKNVHPPPPLSAPQVNTICKYLIKKHWHIHIITHIRP